MTSPIWNTADPCAVTACWTPRVSTREDDARTLVAILEGLQRAIPTIAAWGVLREVLGKVVAIPVALDANTVASILGEGAQTMNLNDGAPPYAYYEQRFFDLKGRFDHPSLTIRAGLQSQAREWFLTSSLTIDLPNAGWARNRDDAFAALRATMTKIVEDLRPIFAYVTPNLPPPIRDLPDGFPVVAWMMFLSDAYGPIGPLSQPIQTRTLGGGTLITAAPYQYDVSQPMHRDALRSLDKQLKGAGVIKPLWP